MKYTTNKFKVGDTVEILDAGFSINSNINLGDIKTIKSFSNLLNNYKHNITFTDGSIGGHYDSWNNYLKLTSISKHYEIYY